MTIDAILVAKWLFWLCLATIAYAYVGFPLLTLLRAAFPKAIHGSATTDANVSVIVAAHNEESDIGAKLSTLLQCDYPHDRMQILVASDGSTDGTEDIVRSFSSDRVTLLSLPRAGKAATLNAAIREATGEILVFTDANSLFAPDAMLELLSPFADPQVGGVAGNQVYQKHDQTASTAAGEQTYWNFDRLLKLAQSRYGSVTSATGAIYAIRRELFQLVPEGVTDDFATSTQVVAQGKRLVFAPRAIAFEPVAKSGDIEFGRKVRVMTRGLRGVWKMRRLMNPFRHGFYALQMFSHKVLRRVVVIPILMLLPTSLLLWNQGAVYKFFAVAQIVFYGLASIGYVLAGTQLARHKFFSIPMFFCMANLAALKAIFNTIRGEQVVIWEPARHVDPKDAELEGDGSSSRRKTASLDATTLETTNR